MAFPIFHNIISLLKLTISDEVLWIVLPFFIATIVMTFYFEKYKEENPGWNTYVANSLVLFFVSIILLRYIYTLDGGLISYINYLDKFLISITLLIFGVILLLLNFDHFLPEKWAWAITSPLSVNSLAYVFILRVFSNLDCSVSTAVSVLLLFVLVVGIFHLIKIPVRRFFKHLKRLKEKEKKQEIVSQKKPIELEKKKLAKEEKRIKAKKKQIKKVEKVVKKKNLKKLDKQKKEAVKLKKLVKK